MDELPNRRTPFYLAAAILIAALWHLIPDLRMRKQMVKNAHHTLSKARSEKREDRVEELLSQGVGELESIFGARSLEAREAAFRAAELLQDRDWLVPALDYYRKCVASDDSSASRDWYRKKGFVEYKLTLIPEAAKSFQFAVHADFTSFGGSTWSGCEDLRDLSNMHLLLGETALALEEAQRALNATGSEYLHASVCLPQLSRVHQARGDLEAARGALEAAAALQVSKNYQSDAADSLGNAAILALLTGKTAAARERVEEALTLCQNKLNLGPQSRLRFVLACLETAEGHVAAGRMQLKRLLEHSPKDRTLTGYLGATRDAEDRKSVV